MFCVKCGKDLTRLLELSSEINTCPFCGMQINKNVFCESVDTQNSNSDEKNDDNINAVNDSSEENAGSSLENIEQEYSDDSDDYIKKEDVKTSGEALRYLIDKKGLSILKKSNQKKLYNDLCGLIPKKDLKAVKTAIDKGAVDILYKAGVKNHDKQKAIKQAYEYLASKTFVSNELAWDAIKAFEFGLRWDKETLEADSLKRLNNALNYQRSIIKKLSALEIKANSGDTNAMLEIAEYYFNNGTNNKEYKRAFEYYKILSEKGDLYSKYKMGCCYRRGIGVKQDLKSAYDCFLEASVENIDAIKNIVDFYNKGLYVEKDAYKEVFWITKAAYMGDAQSQCKLGQCLMKGYGTDINLGQAAYWFGKAAEQNDPVGQLNLGNCYKNGHGVAVDYDKAIEYYTLAANQDNAQAQYLLGNYYYWGRGVGQEYDTAVYWFTKAAKQGLPIAEYVLARCYETGSGVNRSYTQALRWYTDAYESGYDKAKKDCERVELKLKGKYDVKKK